MSFLGRTVRIGCSLAIAVVVTMGIAGRDGHVAQAQTPDAPGIVITSPQQRAILQRVDGADTPVRVRGYVVGDPSTVEVRAVSRDELAPFETAWFRADEDAKLFDIEVPLSPGWYTVEARTVAAPTAVVSHGPIGVGEVFITAGQSNAANYGTDLMSPGDERVSALDIDRRTWTEGADPQPSAAGNAGSPWPAFASELAVALDMPVAVVAVGIGGDPIKYWDPRAPLGSTHYDRIKTAIDQLGPNGIRAILWHQGESDIRTDIVEYRDALEALIAQSRVDAGFAVPWGVAIVSNGVEDANVVKAQQAVIDRDPLVYRGPNTNDFAARGFLGDLIHFNRPGLIEHGHQWFASTIAFFDLLPQTRQAGDLDCSLGAANGADVIAALRAVVDLPIAGPAGLPLRCSSQAGSDTERCDVDGDNKCSVRDALLIAQCLAGKATACAAIEGP